MHMFVLSCCLKKSEQTAGERLREMDTRQTLRVQENIRHSFLSVDPPGTRRIFCMVETTARVPRLLSQARGALASSREPLRHQSPRTILDQNLRSACCRPCVRRQRHVSSRSSVPPFFPQRRAADLSAWPSIKDNAVERGNL